MFTGFPEETIRFFLDLRFHNEAAFFNAHRDEYERYIREPFYGFIEAMAPAVKQVSDDMELRPDKCLARIRRDTRFTKDKTPYRDHLWLLFRRSGEARDISVMYWFELAPEHVEWGLGFWGNNRPAMDALRKRIRNKPDEVAQAFRDARVPDRDLEIYGDRYQRMAIPEGLPQLLQEVYPLKEIYVKRTNLPIQMVYSQAVVERCSQDLLRLKPLYLLLRKMADEGMSTLEG